MKNNRRNGGYWVVALIILFQLALLLLLNVEGYELLVERAGNSIIINLNIVLNPDFYQRIMSLLGFSAFFWGALKPFNR